MARVPMNGVFTDGEGKIVVDGSVTIYEYNSAAPDVPTVLAIIYDAQSGGSVIAGSVVTTDSNGAYEAWFDDVDYAGNQAFTLILAKDGFQDNPWHFSLPGLSYASATETLTNKTIVDCLFSGIQILDTTQDHEYTIGVSELSADRTITLPLLTGNDTFAVLSLAQTLLNKTLTSPKIGTDILDTNGNELINLTATGSAVNEITLANAATANNPTITASGNDTNVGINFVPKGTGKIQIGGVQVPVTTDLYTYRTGLVCTRASTTTITVAAGEVMVDGTPVRKQTDTTLALTSAGDWVDNSSDRAADTKGYIYINNAGTIELDDAAPDASDSSDNTSGTLHYNNTGTDTSWRRCIGAFYMNSSQELGTNDVWVYPEITGIIHLATEQASTSGTAIDFVSIPSGVKKIVINFVGVSTDGTQEIMVQLGDSGGFETSGYLGTAGSFTTSGQAATAFTTGFGIDSTGSAASVIHGIMTLTLEDSNNFTWVAGFSGARSNSASVLVGSGSKSLSSELTQVRITTNGTPDDFDAGSINIQYE